MLNGNLLETKNYSDWAWTKNASVALAPGPQVVTLCFIGKALMTVSQSPHSCDVDSTTGKPHPPPTVTTAVAVRMRSTFLSNKTTQPALESIERRAS